MKNNMRKLQKEEQTLKIMALLQNQLFHMTHHRPKLSVQELVELLERPKRKSTHKVKEPMVDREEVRKHMRLKWKDPNYCSSEFSKAPVLKPKILNEWEADRIHMSLRSYKTPKNVQPYRFDSESRPFPKVSTRLYSEKFQRYLKQTESEKQDLQFKEKRTITEGMSHFSTIREKLSKASMFFKPVTPSTDLFGFTSSQQIWKRRHHNIHMKTLEV